MSLTPVSFVILWLIGGVGVAIFDLIWIVFVMKSVYKEHLGHLLSTKSDSSLDPSIASAITVWAILAWGMMVFVIPRISTTNVIGGGLLWGSLWGFTVHALYDITNVATLKNWPILITVMDILWGSFKCAVVTVFVALIAMQFFQ